MRVASLTDLNECLGWTTIKDHETRKVACGGVASGNGRWLRLLALRAASDQSLGGDR